MAEQEPSLGPHGPKQKAGPGALMLNVLGILVVGSQNLSSNFSSASKGAVFTGLCTGCLLLVPAACFEMWTHRKETGRTWHERYGDTPANQMLMGIVYACFLSMVVHIVDLVVSRDCDICTGKRFGIVALGKVYYPLAYWIHILPSGIIAFLGPLQFTVRVRKFLNYFAHRWIGRVILIACLFHQASATVLTVSNLFFTPPPDTFGTDALGPMRYRIYAAGFVPKNALSWAASVMGYVRARQGRIAEHGAWMYRLGSMWLITIVTAHVIIYPVIYLAGPIWSFPIGEWVNLLCYIPVELYVRRSGRFKAEAEAVGSGLSERFITA